MEIKGIGVQENAGILSVENTNKDDAS